MSCSSLSYGYFSDRFGFPRGGRGGTRAQASG